MATRGFFLFGAALVAAGALVAVWPRHSEGAAPPAAAEHPPEQQHRPTITDATDPGKTPLPRATLRPTSPPADALALGEVQQLVTQNRISEARARARRFYREFPGNAYAPRIERLTGVHPRPALPE